MARQFMPKSSALMPYVVVNRDAAVAGVFTVDGEAGSVVLTGKYVQIVDYDQRVGSLEAKVTTNTGDITDLKTAVSSINGSITSINSSLSNKAAKGANSDITSLTALSGPLRLGGDAVNAYDAVTLRQLQSSSGGSGGASLNGVMNNFLGAVEWFNGSRAKLPAGHVAADGQLLNRADYPDIWNAINSGVFISVDDTTWLNASGSQYVHRGKYSTGNGTTTFRMPDLNGQTSGSIIPFLRGDGSGGSVGVVYESGAPNISGSIGAMVWSDFGSATGAFAPGSPNTNVSALGTSTPAPFVTFDASKSSGVYGRANEVRPQSVIGIWIIRVNGAYNASNTNFNVITGDTTSPANGAIVYGGDVRSVYQVGGVDTSVASFRTKYTVGGAKTAEIRVLNGSTTTSWTMPNTSGQLVLSTDSRLSSVDGKSGGYINGGLITTFTSDTAAQGHAIGTSIKNTSGYEHTKLTLLPEVAANGNRYAHLILSQDANFKEWYFDYNQGNAYSPNSWVNLSDKRVKTDIEAISDPLGKMKKLRGCTWTRIDEQSNGKFGIGFIAQDVQAIFPDAVSVGPTGSMKVDGEVIEKPLALNAGDVAAGLHHEAILALMEKVEALEKELAKLKAE